MYQKLEFVTTSPNKNYSQNSETRVNLNIKAEKFSLKSEKKLGQEAKL